MSIVIDDEFLYTYVPQAEQAMLERIPKESELHHHFSRRFRRNMRALLRDERRMPETRKFVYWCKVAAAIFAVAVTMSFGVLMSVEASRTRIIEAVTKIFSDYTSLRISADGGLSDRVLRPIAPTYVPEGYVMGYEESNQMSYQIHYENKAGIVLVYVQELLAASGYTFDTEDAYTGTVMIGGQEIQTIMKESKNGYTIYWYDKLYFYWISGEIELKDEILKMAESVIAQ